MTAARLQALLLALIVGALIFVGVRIGSLTQAIREAGPRAGQALTAEVPREGAGDIVAAAKIAPGGSGPSLDASKLTPPSPDDPVDGSPDARISLTSFMDLECPYCAKFFPAARQLVAESKGGVNFHFRHFPIESHPNAMTLGVAAECVRSVAGDRAFFELVGQIYAAGQIGDVEGWLTKALAAAKIDGKAVQTCRSSGLERTKLSAMAAQAIELGVSATPTTVLYDSASRRTKVVMGFRGPEHLQKEITELQR